MPLTTACEADPGATNWPSPSPRPVFSEFIPLTLYLLNAIVVPVMWEISSLTSPTELAVRRILTYALAALCVAFFGVILIAPPIHAADASWQGNILQYGGNSYNGPASAKTIQDLGLIAGTNAYTYVDPASTTVGSGPATQRQIHVIYFAPGVDSSVATSAKYKTYIYQGPSSFTNPSSPSDISLTKQSSTAANPGTSSCNVDSGVGWMVCPITDFLAKRMDGVFNLLSGFLAVRPVETGQDNALFRAWTYMRSFANVAFVIGFLIIIYSQLTNLGINNYSVKKLLPRLIIAAILVNLSYYICSIAVDLSNILGYSIQDVFIQLRNSLVGTEGNSWSVVSWASITGFILSGGTLVAAGSIGLIATLSTYGVAGSIILLIPALVTGLIAVLVAIVVMAARQAIITILIILAPLAFVAYLLPNTDKWFGKWRELFTTMLILFPAFSVVFGGSQLAAAAIIQNADSINLIILGMLVQVAPLLITPLLIKLSGSLLGRVAGMVNNPNKGLIDRTKNWSKDRSDNVKAKRLSDEGIKRHQFLRRNAQRVDHNRRNREGKRKNHEGQADNRFAGSYDAKVLHEAQHEIETAKKTIEESLSRDITVKIQATPEMLKKEMAMRVTTDEAATEKAKLDKVHDDLRARRYDSIDGDYPNHVLSSLSTRSEEATRTLALAGIGSQFAKRKQQLQLADATGANTELIDGIRLREYAGGIDGQNGEKSVLASAMNVQHEAEVKIVNERAQMMRQFNVSGTDMHTIAKGTADVSASYTSESGQAYTYTFARGDTWTQDAAIDTQLKIGSLQQKLEIMELSGVASAQGGLNNFVKTIKDGISANNLGAQAVFLSGRTIDLVGQGQVIGHQGLLSATADFILNGKYKAEDLANNGAEAITVLLQAAQRATNVNPGDMPLFRERVQALKETAGSILDPEVNVGRNASEATRTKLTELYNQL